MFMKRIIRAEKAYTYRMLLSFKTSVTYHKKLNFAADNCVRCEAVFVGYNSDIVQVFDFT